MKYPTLLFLFPLFDVVWGLPVDYMHAICLGVAKRLTSLWFDSAHSRSPWSFVKRISEIDQALRQTKPPRTIRSLPRPIRDKQHWKGYPLPSSLSDRMWLLTSSPHTPLPPFPFLAAIELRNWLLFFAPVVLEQILPDLFFRNLIVLVQVLHLLLSRSISAKALDAAENNIRVFLQSFEALYGDFLSLIFRVFPTDSDFSVLGLRYETLNFHLLLHLIACVRLYGPLWTVSCFPFETANGFLVRCISGTNSSMTNMLVTAGCLSNVRLIKDIVSPEVSPFVKELLGDPPPTK